MTAFDLSAVSIVAGDVVHKRLRPRPHALRYRIFTLLLDLDRQGEAAAQCRLFSGTRRNALEHRASDHLSGQGDLAAEARALFEAGGHRTADCRVLLLATPRVLGFTFNPLSVFLLIDPQGDVRAAIYEVSNTFGERRSHVIAAGPREAGVHRHGFTKQLFVSPFAAADGRYDMRLDLAADHVTLGVMFRDPDGPLIKTYLRGMIAPLTTRSAAAALARMPLLTFKIVAGIHWEALKIWVKGVPLVRRRRSPRYAVTHDQARIARDAAEISHVRS